MNMEHRRLSSARRKEVAQLFTAVFTSSEGREEGQRIGDLADALAADIDDQSIICYATYDERSLIGSIFLSRLLFKESIRVFMLAPVAVSSDHQGKGVGKSLINYGLNELKDRSVDVVVTYGDPSFYAQVGFHGLSEKVIQAPLKLSMPEGWLGQSLTGSAIPVISERPACVKAFNDPVYW